MYGLKRITLHNSYYSGLTLSVSTDGHTNCSGTNAAGKTSMLQLVPLFYGCPPRYLNPKNRDKLPFLDFVLPQSSSLIVYDYRRHDGNCCAVIYRSSTQGIAYRFIRGNSSEVFFADAIAPMLRSGRPAPEIFAAINQMGVEMSNQLLTITDYAAVLQGDMATLKRSGDKSWLKAAQQFSLATARSPMRLMGEMTFTLLKRAKMYERLKLMIAETQFDYTPPRIPKHRNNERLSRDLKSLREFEQQQVRIRECVRQHRERMNLTQAISRFAGGLAVALANAEQQKQNLESQLNACLAAQEAGEFQFKQEFSELTEQIIASEKQLQAVSRSIQRAETEHETWFAENMPGKIAEYERLSEFQDRAETAHRHYLQLVSENRDIADEKDRHINDIQTRLLKREQSFLHRQHALREQRAELRDRCNAQKDIFLRALAQHQQAAQQHYQHQREQLLAAIAELNAELRHSSATEQETLLEAEAQQKIELYDQQLESLTHQLQQQQRKATQSHHSHQQALDAVESLRRKIQQTEVAISQLETLLFPADGTLLTFLRSEYAGNSHSPEQHTAERSNWLDSIGKLIRPELLQRTDLAPSLSPGNNFYGLDLRLDALPMMEHCAEASALTEKHALLLQQRQTQAHDLQKLNQNLVNAQQLRQTAERAAEQTEHELRQLRQTRQGAKDYLQRLRQQHQQHQQERKQALKIQLDALQQQLAHEQQQYQTNSALLLDDHAAQTHELQNEQLVEQSDLDSALQQLHDEWRSDCETAEQEKAEVLLAYQRQCESRSLDDQALIQAKNRWTQATQKYDSVRQTAAQIQSYQLWVRDVWSLMAQHRQQKSVAQNQLNQLQQTLQQLKANQQAQKIQFRQQQKLLESELRSLSTIIHDAKDLLKSARLPHAETMSDIETGDLSLLCSQLQNLLLRDNDLKNQLLISIDKALQILQSNPDSRIYDAWKLLLDSRLANSLYAEHSEAFRLNLAMDLEALLDKQLPHIHGALVQTVKSVGGAFEAFYLTLRQLELDVARVSETLKTRINTDQRIAALRDIELSLSSRVSTAIEGWQDMQRFIELWQDWNRGVDHQLPPEALEEALCRVIQIFQFANISTDIYSLFDLRIHMIEGGRAAVIDSNASFDDASSNGLSYLALVVIFVGMSRYLCPDTDITLTWPIDELATLDPKNVAAMFTMLKHNNIQVFSAFPSTDYNLLQHFTNRYLLDREKGAREFVDDTTESSNIRQILAKLSTHAEMQ